MPRISFQISPYMLEDYYNEEGQLSFIKIWYSDPGYSYQNRIDIGYSNGLISRIKRNYFDPETDVKGIFTNIKTPPFSELDMEFEYDSRGNWIKLYDYDYDYRKKKKNTKKKKLRLERIITYK